ncbi:bifunctional diguanylate cyclase/phosphodiesterase [Glaciimonas immobilis]|uniref:Diguanylate cyclase (GGDEF)-like protein n=1 Tax=Glaciimonas immobilis TaxID=728004 RepID=A0A840RWW6_9BURK|nr:EAL domain-containing protein [Glaciimonas immobilis]KAF3998709.1 EAL domain-containing protein [Glaciimonas immobilis]MBB5201588.1 diguanylate cyclase (GGDEF)-like protein [Glaciimonas immobilis]
MAFKTVLSRRGHEYLLALLVAFNVLLLVGLWVGIQIYTKNERIAAVRSASGDMDNLVRSYEQYILRTLHHDDEVVKFIKFQYESNEGVIDLPNFVERGLLSSDILTLASVIDAKGNLIATSRRQPIEKTNLHDREHFRVHIDADSQKMFISKVVRGRISGAETLQMTRRLNHDDGSFAGVVVLSATPSTFTDFYNKADFGTHGMVGLLGTDGAYRAIRIGDAEKSKISVNFLDTLAMLTAAHKSEASVVLSAIDKTPRVTAYRMLSEYPLMVSVGISMDDVLRDVNLAAVTHYRWAAGATGIILIFLFVTGLLAFQLKKHQIKMEFLAGHDSLTQLPNRLLFLRHLQSAMDLFPAQSGGTAVLFIDLDNFKNINDSLGHETGDQMLCAVARRLQSSVRSTDTVYRLGGDEFTVILNNFTNDRLAVLASIRILTELEQPFTINERFLSIGASVGISRYPLDGNTTSEILQHADMAMYQAKTEQKGAYRFFSARLGNELADRLTLEQSIRVGISRHEFFLNYQPKVDLQTEKIVGFEALMRWRHPSKGIVLPGEFIPVAETTGLILPLGRQAIEMACSQMQRWHQAGLGWIPVAVNVSARQFNSDHLVKDILAALAKYGVPSSVLEVELTESLVMDDPVIAETILLELRAIGIKISIDDFGAGHSSLASLMHYSVDCLKIDRAFIQNSSTEIIRAVISLAKSFDLQVVAEGVETSTQRDMLKGLSCEIAQGYFYSMPVTAEEVPDLLLKFSGTNPLEILGDDYQATPARKHEA